MPGTDQLRYVKAGDRPSASQQNILIDAAKAKQSGSEAFTSGQGYVQRPDASKVSHIAQFRVNEDPPDPIEARDYLTCVEVDGDEVVSDDVVVALSEHTKPVSHLYARDMILFAAEVIDDFGETDDDDNPIMWLEVVPPVLVGDPVDLTYTGGSTTAVTGTWDRDNQTGNGMTKRYQRIEWDDENKKLVAFEWTETVDAFGRKVGSTLEVARDIVQFEAC